MRKILFVIFSLTFLFFSTNSLAFDCNPEFPCDEFVLTSEYCKCLAEFNSECFDGSEFEVCQSSWDGEPYTEFSSCMKGLLPFDRLLFGPGNNSVAAVCKFFIQNFMDSFTYKNLGQCMKDKASKYTLSEDDSGFGPPCSFYDGKLTWV